MKTCGGVGWAPERTVCAHPTSHLAALWAQGSVIPFNKDADHTGIRPIALQEALMKLVEGSIRVTLARRIAAALPPTQYGVGAHASAQRAAEIL